MIVPHVTVRRSNDLPARAEVQGALRQGLLQGVQRLMARAESAFRRVVKRSRIGPKLTVTVKRGGDSVTLATTNFHARLLEHGATAHFETVEDAALGPKARRNRDRRDARLRAQGLPVAARPRMLRFVGREGVVFRRHVHRGAQPPRPWLGPTVLQTGKDDVRQSLDARLRETFGG